LDRNFEGEEEYSRLLEKINVQESKLKWPKKWDKKFKNYYFRYLDCDIRKSFRGAVAKFGIFNPHSGVTSNAR